MPRKLLASRLKLARGELGVSQFELGVLVGFDEATAKSRVSHYENAVNVPTLEAMQKLAIALRKPMAWFFCRDDELELISLLDRQKEGERKRIIESIVKLLHLSD